MNIEHIIIHIEHVFFVYPYMQHLWKGRKGLYSKSNGAHTYICRSYIVYVNESIRGMVERKCRAINTEQMFIYIDHISEHSFVEHRRNGGEEM